MRLNSIKNADFSAAQNTQKTNAKEMKRIDISFGGNITSKDAISKLSKNSTNLVFTANQSTKNAIINGQSIGRKNILVTGAAGYIGSHTAKYLLENGYDIVSIDDYKFGNKEAAEELKK